MLRIIKGTISVILAFLFLIGDCRAENGVFRVPMDLVKREDQSEQIDDAIWLYYGLATLEAARQYSTVNELLFAMEEKHIYYRDLFCRGNEYHLVYLDDFTVKLTADNAGNVSYLAILITCPLHGHVFELAVDPHPSDTPVHEYSPTEFYYQSDELHECLSEPHRMSSKAATSVFHALQLLTVSIHQSNPSLVEQIEDNWPAIYGRYPADSFCIQREGLYSTQYRWKLAYNPALDLYFSSSGDTNCSQLILCCNLNNPSDNEIFFTISTPPLLPDLFVFVKDNVVEQLTGNKISNHVLYYDFGRIPYIFIDGSPSLIK